MGFIFRSHSFFPFWANKFPNLGHVYLKSTPPPIPLFLSLYYLLALPSLRENSDTPQIYKQMLGNSNALFSQSTFSWAIPGPMCVLGLPTLAFHCATGKCVILSLLQHVSCPQEARWQPRHNLSSLSKLSVIPQALSN